MKYAIALILVLVGATAALADPEIYPNGGANGGLCFGPNCRK